MIPENIENRLSKENLEEIFEESESISIPREFNSKKSIELVPTLHPTEEES